jgi:hypothetical protein
VPLLLQLLPHAPQLRTSFIRSTQLVPQQV